MFLLLNNNTPKVITYGRLKTIIGSTPILVKTEEFAPAFKTAKTKLKTPIHGIFHPPVIKIANAK
ncbi:hypothetical protein IJQ19_00865 [bacterium]|nr:hypothetical protein [bacterium]